MKKFTLEEAQIASDAFTQDIKSITLATVDENGEPFSSYSPYVEDEDKNYYICVSAIVPHSHNMSVTKKAHIMFLQDESACADVYARGRLYFKATAEKFEENDKREEKISKLFVEKFGKTAEFLMKMPDFRIYKLTPSEGNIVLGFGAAYSLDENRKIIAQNTGGEKEGSGKHPHGHAHDKSNGHPHGHPHGKA